ncbi:hypothetical protein Pint_27462 [Pistacia integerrima]|uniref:Uncharacterized protein n=1 Tax=Pistacia integerrima TaxID=434235 RepID=A0ACC0YTT9_9ROSI|nr:hypothetical protein Pint_27462 [Pistacia integerrima]
MASKTNNKGVAHFFKEFLPKHGYDGFKIPNAFVKYLNGSLKKAVLRNRMGKRWHVEMADTDSMVLFANGWQKFVEDNYVEPADSLVFSYHGDHIFDVLIFEKCGCEKRETSANVSIDIEVKMEEKEDEDDIVVINVDDECGAANYEDCTKEEEGEKDDTEEEEATIIAKRRGKKILGINGGSKRRADINPGLHEGVGAVSHDQPQNPYFMWKNKGYRKNHLKRETRTYVSNMEVKMEETEDAGENDGDEDYIKEEEGRSKRRASVNARLHEGVEAINYNVSPKFLKDFEIELAENIFFHDELERKWCGKVCNWKDGRTVIHGWADVCRWNHVKKDDVCICEFLQTEGNVQDIMKVRIIRSSSSRS